MSNELAIKRHARWKYFFRVRYSWGCQESSSFPEKCLVKELILAIEPPVQLTKIDFTFKLSRQSTGSRSSYKAVKLRLFYPIVENIFILPRRLSPVLLTGFFLLVISEYSKISAQEGATRQMEVWTTDSPASLHVNVTNGYPEQSSASKTS